MKLKYYLRGLGIGVLVTTFVMRAAINGEAMTDEEIKARAAELGMTEQRAVVLSDLINEKDKQPTDANDKKEEEPSEDEGIQAGGGTEEAEGASGETDESSEEAEGESEEPTGESEEPAGASEEDDEVVTIVVELGESSLSVSRSLAEAGLVADAQEYDKYLCSNGYSKKIRSGTYKIPIGSSEEEIADIIMRK